MNGTLTSSSIASPVKYRTAYKDKQWKLKSRDGDYS